ncbi:hypothetical protein Tco_1262958 [Tanacetum coccineum]
MEGRETFRLSDLQTLKQRLSDMEGCVERRKGSLNLNMETRDDEEYDVQEVQRAMGKDGKKKRRAASSA